MLRDLESNIYLYKLYLIGTDRKDILSNYNRFKKEYNR